MSQSFHTGGTGAHGRMTGCRPRPSRRACNVPVEITEAITPLVFWKKELRAISGGAGAFRGGLGQIIEVGSRDGEPFAIFARFQRVKHPARGRAGGEDGARALSLASGASSAKGTQVIPAGERLVVEMPGGGGHGDPAERDPGGRRIRRRERIRLRACGARHLQGLSTPMGTLMKR